MIIELLVSTVLASTSYKTDALPIFKARCSMCHNRDTPDKNWLDYDTAKSKSSLILRRAWVLKDMPPGNITEINDKERETIRDWINGGTLP